VHPATRRPRSATDRGSIVGAIPARYASTRLPGKPLLPLAGRPMIEHVYERARRAPALERVVVLTDDPRIARAVEGFGGEVELTPAECRSGTDRIAWAARRWEGVAAVVNVQGDEPLIDPRALDTVARHLAEHPEDPMVTLATPAEPDEWEDPNAVKVVTDAAGYALYFSRSRIPFPRHGIRVLDGGRMAPGVDTPEDLERVEEILRRGSAGTGRANGSRGNQTEEGAE
jgi:3-deoxy-manno-octulosonate cytidylyltransferase (CMP-KDO synthetase)